MRGLFVVVLVALPFIRVAPELKITMVGNAGVFLSDGDSSLLIDLPYESGAYGYMTYEPSNLNPPGIVAAIITHDHADHFDPSLFVERGDWRIIGPPSVTDTLPSDRVIPGDSVSLGAFTVVVLPTHHTEDHRSYRIYWRGRILHFSGDSEVVDHLSDIDNLDLLFITPWLSCMATEAGLLGIADRTIAYHLLPDGGDTLCGDPDTLPQGSSFKLSPADD